MLPAQELIGWQTVAGEEFPTPNTDETVVFLPFFYFGLGLPSSDFLQGVLHFYGINLHHLNPNSILHMAIFAHLSVVHCGVYLHFALFRHLYHMKPQPSRKHPKVIGGARIQLRLERKNELFDLPLRSSNKGWRSEWFYYANLLSGLPPYIRHALVARDCWSSLPVGDEA